MDYLMWQITVEAPLSEEDCNSFLTVLFSQLASQTGSNPSTAAGNTPPDMPSSPQDEDFPECDWSEHYCPDGVKYYYNCVTCESRVMFQLFIFCSYNLFFGFLLLRCVMVTLGAVGEAWRVCLVRERISEAAGAGE